VETALPDIDDDDGSTVAIEAFIQCALGADVVLYKIVGGGHKWPGERQYAARLLIGPINRDISATEALWRFFETHPMESRGTLLP
jgi:polyhydroxybutyrate depolymerase